MVMKNDLYRLFYEPVEYVNGMDELENERMCVKRIWGDVTTMLGELKGNLKELIMITLRQNKEMMCKNDRVGFGSPLESERSPKYIV
jgi:hypothetical protein